MYQVIGQPRAVTLLKRSLELGTVAHAYLLVGPPHVGKGTLALNLAQALNCASAAPPCGECVSCRRILAAKHSDVRTVRLLAPMPDGDTAQRTQISIKDFEDIEYAANLPPYEGKRKVFIIDGAENLSAAASNRLLKVLEEPLPHVVWVLIAAQEARLLPTVISRCQRIELRPMPVAEVARTLRETRQVEPARADLLARLSAGCLGWAITASTDGSMLDERGRRLDRFLEVLGAGLAERIELAGEMGGVIERDRAGGLDTLRLWLGWLRDALMVKTGCREAVVNLDYMKSIEAAAGGMTLAQVREGIVAMRAAISEIERNVGARLALEQLVLNLVAVPALAPLVETAPAAAGEPG